MRYENPPFRLETSNNQAIWFGAWWAIEQAAAFEVYVGIHESGEGGWGLERAIEHQQRELVSSFCELHHDNSEVFIPILVEVASDNVWVIIAYGFPHATIASTHLTYVSRAITVSIGG
jgi:hypothetical protein